ncbi:fatty acid/phospholipid synthesis protein PlsX [Mesomycoplasma conjunctivae]|uniref:Phosphate acyltransferase n=1 Tax=Mesomycoplasma conjunctivae (strain ATCC 25834 / NCTC 10147 / HRC/581) TaxID=572263 RepID=C5J6D5_MESCH|nr:phosphate acyltransferase PlsX [Mesomycoplasma conjunctivae]CAT05027.1 Fatty acid/phospholipid synthesis protein plsX [Mesomycoplasma conjunctivae]VEU66315.1 fatty acid/phospholipid synthesis protein PlsX [Mesomycoplasma conjunctivae]
MNKRNYKIAFDVQNKEYTLNAASLAAYDFAKENPNFHIYIIGDEAKITQVIKPIANISIINNPEIATKSETLRDVHRKNNSMNSALDLLAAKKVDAVLSPAESSLIISSSFLKLETIKGVRRPGFMPSIPTIGNLPILMVDVGANTNVQAQFLYQWANVASIFYQSLYGLSDPKVGIINIGTEKRKGLEFHREAYQMMAEDSKINFIGFVEPQHLLEGDCQIFVCDGYAGNLVLKTLEGATLSIFKLFKQQIKSSLKSKIGGILIKDKFNDLKEKFDYRNVGAAWIMGIDGIILKTHGNSNKLAFLGALNQVKIALDTQVLEKVKEKLDENQ